VKADKLYLVGFMGAGKSTVARALGRRTGWRVEDIDERIEAREHRSVASIFAQQGEAYFRQLERMALGELLPLRHVVVATGGGTFVEADNRALMLADGAVAWLDLPLTQVIERVPADGRRPLAADLAQMERLFAGRQHAYALAHLRISASASRPDEIAERILDALPRE
jgi:shikimate kinase